MDAVLNKIKALLAKASSTTHEGEAMLYFNKAKELMEKYQIESVDLDSTDPVGEEETLYRKNNVSPDWDFRLYGSVAKYYGCRAIHMDGHGHSYCVIGRQSARVTTHEMHKYLVATVRRLGRERCAQMGVNASKAARLIGNALHTRLHNLCVETVVPETEAGKNALATLDAVDAWVKEHHPNTYLSVTRTLSNSTAHSIAAGIGLHQQTGHSAAKAIR